MPSVAAKVKPMYLVTDVLNSEKTLCRDKTSMAKLLKVNRNTIKVTNENIVWRNFLIEPMWCK